jgi:hypothetical protein
LFGTKSDRVAILILSGAIPSGWDKCGFFGRVNAGVLAESLGPILVEYMISVVSVLLVCGADRIPDTVVEVYPALNVGPLLTEDNLLPVCDVVLFVPEELIDLGLEDVATADISFFSLILSLCKGGVKG